MKGLVMSTAVLVCSCASDPFTSYVPNVIPVPSEVADENTQEFSELLEAAIQDADYLIIKEHSHRTDFFGTEVGMEGSPEYIYAQKKLSLGEKIIFLEDVRKLKDVANEDQLDCLFAPHHTIQFYEKEYLISSMEICYECDEIQWSGSGSDAIASIEVLDVISKVIKRADMKTERTWEDMAKQRYQEENAPKLANPNPNPNPNPIKQGPPTAKWAAGQEGEKVINPFTGGIVDVEGIPANTKVRDPNDRDPSHIFRVPAN